MPTRTVEFPLIFLAAPLGEVDLTLCVKDGGVKSIFIKPYSNPSVTTQGRDSSPKGAPKKILSTLRYPKEAPRISQPQRRWLGHVATKYKYQSTTVFSVPAFKLRLSS